MVADYLKQWHITGQFSNDQWKKNYRMRNGGLQKPREIRYKIINNIVDIKSCFRLRYLTYRYVNFIEENKDHLDIDPYDKYSTFLGAYDVTKGKKILVGTLRIISADEKSKNYSQTEKLISTARDPKISGISKRTELFPIMESFILPESYLVSFRNLKSNKNLLNLHELSRLAVRPDYWMHNIDVGLHHLLILDSWQHNPKRNDFLIAVHPRSCKRYERVGFRIVPGTDEVLYKHINQLAIAMILDLDQYLQRPESYKEICESLLPYYEKKGYFTRTIERRKQINNSKSE